MKEIDLDFHDETSSFDEKEDRIEIEEALDEADEEIENEQFSIED